MQPGPAPFSPADDKQDPFTPVPQVDAFGSVATSAPPTAPPAATPQTVFVGQPATVPSQQAVGLEPGMIAIGGGSPLGYAGPPATSAVTALVLAILSWVCGGLCFSIPAVIIAGNALAVTNQYPGHPDAGTAKAAQITAWINIGLSILVIGFYAVMIMLAVMSDGSGY